MHEPSDDRAQRVESRVDVTRAVRSLSAEERRAVAYRYWLDYTQPQAAAELGVPEGTMKIRLHRARSKLELMLSP